MRRGSLATMVRGGKEDVALSVHRRKRDSSTAPAGPVRGKRTGGKKPADSGPIDGLSFLRTLANAGATVQLTGQLVQGFAGLVELGELFFFGAEFGGVRD